MRSISEIQLPTAPGNLMISNDKGPTATCKIWDTGTGKVVHSLPIAYPRRSSMYANVVAIITGQDMKVYDLLEGTEPVKEISQTYQQMEELMVTPRKIVVVCPYIWATTPFAN